MSGRNAPFSMNMAVVLCEGSVCSSPTLVKSTLLPLFFRNHAGRSPDPRSSSISRSPDQRPLSTVAQGFLAACTFARYDFARRSRVVYALRLLLGRSNKYFDGIAVCMQPQTYALARRFASKSDIITSKIFFWTPCRCLKRSMRGSEK
jgi:hypothetical protein